VLWQAAPRSTSRRTFEAGPEATLEACIELAVTEIAAVVGR
jgi:hypothetical protein